MRATVSDVLRHPSWLRDWWGDGPWRHRVWWHQLLLEPGEGWLRWKGDWRHETCWDPPSHEEWMVFPPARRLWFFLAAWARHPGMVLRGDVRWSEAPSWSDGEFYTYQDRWNDLQMRPYGKRKRR